MKTLLKTAALAAALGLAGATVTAPAFAAKSSPAKTAKQKKKPVNKSAAKKKAKPKGAGFLAPGTKYFFNPQPEPPADLPMQNPQK